ncbi:RIH domain protein [Ancylostoma duodenale]|uniref:RIH domain protein n=1 Tax=Ancylostoma duodenale TaxID=51022 RepID=A0A0C2CLV8_9BILA|nr:RIH domain protein [Ancylostoma duodenale]
MVYSALSEYAFVRKDSDIPPDIAICMLYIDNALSMRALQEMMSADSEHKSASGAGGHKTLLYGHAVQLKHVQSEMYLACLSSCSSNDKLAFDVGVQETNEGEACWWTIHPASKQRSEGEKVRVGDDVILVSVATERYLLGFEGYVFGNDVMRLFHGNDECLTIPENWSEHPQHNMVIYEGGAAVNQARSLWRIELIRMKWHGAMVGWEQLFRIKHITSGRYLGVIENAVQLYHKDKADFDLTAFVMCQNKDPKKQMLDEKEEEGMGAATIQYGETNAFIQHVKTQLWMSYQTSEVTKKGLGKVEEKKAVALKDGHMDDCYTFFMALEEESKSARVIRKCSSVLNRFLKGIDALQNEGHHSADWARVDLNEVLKLMEDLIEYFSQPSDEQDFEEKQTRFRALRSRQDLFQEEGVLNMILDTIDKFSQMEALPDFAGLIGEETHMMWEEIATYLYLLVAAMIKGNHYNCAQFAAAQRLDWLFGRLSNPQSAEGILDVLYCVLTESPEALNMINEGHIRSVISLLEKVGRDPKVLDVLSSLCEGNGMAVRSSQNLITAYLLPGKDLLLQTAMRDHLYHKDKADFDLTAFVMCQNKDPKKQMLDEKEEEGMGAATIQYGETNAFIQHVKTQLWMSYQTSEVTKKGLGKVEEKKAVALKDGHMDDCYTFFMALEEESKSARVIRKCSSVLNRFLKGIDALQNEGHHSADWARVDLNEVLKLMEDLIEYFSQPSDEQDFEEKQTRFRALRSRQDLFQEEGVLNMILDTIDKFSQMEALPDFAGLIGEETHMMWEEIATYLYLLVAAMIKGNHYNCAQFAAAQRLDWLFGRLSNPQSAEGMESSRQLFAGIFFLFCC